VRVANLAPGLYYEPVQPVRADGPLARGDVPLFIGFTRRGPVRQAVRVESIREVATLFGEPLAVGHLMPALRGFFETGGASAYVMRLAIGTDLDEGVAGHLFANGWSASAAFNWRLIDPRKLSGTTGLNAPGWSSMVEAAIRDGASTPDPGQWGNRLSLSIARGSQPLIETEPLGDGEDRRVLVPSLAGLEAGGIVELFQDSTTAAATLAAVDPAMLTVELARPIAELGLDARRPFRLTSVEFRIDVLLDGRLAERFERVSLAPGHSRAVAAAMASSRYVALKAPAGFDPALEQQWLPEGVFALGGGGDRVRAEPWQKMREAYLLALEAASRVEEAALVAAPDLVLQPPDLVPASPSPPRPADCCNLEPSPVASLSARVVDGETGVAVAGVRVEAAGEAPSALTGADGGFTLAPLPPGLFTVRLTKPGYEIAELMLQSAEFAAPIPETIRLAPLAFPTRLADSAILEIQRAMASDAGPYRVAIVDPPSPDMKPDALLTWRSRLGDSNRLAFFAPWVIAPDNVPVPPSGHVCGALAAGEIAGGIARAPANLPLRHAIAPSLAIDESTQAVLHASAVNAIRAFPGRGLRIWGSRTLSSDPEWRQLTSRRVVDAIERTLEATLQWVVFEPNSLITRQAVAFTIETLLERLWRGGGLAGGTPAAAYRVQCDLDNNPDSDRSRGELVAEVAVAPAIPFEFILFRIAKSLDHLNVGD
jgi:hypothetical protein